MVALDKTTNQIHMPGMRTSWPEYGNSERKSKMKNENKIIKTSQKMIEEKKIVDGKWICNI